MTHEKTHSDSAVLMKLIEGKVRRTVADVFSRGAMCDRVRMGEGALSSAYAKVHTGGAGGLRHSEVSASASASASGSVAVAVAVAAAAAVSDSLGLCVSVSLPHLPAGGAVAGAAACGCGRRGPR